MPSLFQAIEGCVSNLSTSIVTNPTMRDLMLREFKGTSSVRTRTAKGFFFCRARSAMLTLASLIASLVLLFSASPCSAEAMPRSVLILDESGPGGLNPGYAELSRAFRDALIAKSRVRIYATNLDLNQFSGPEYVALQKNYIREKYRNIPIGALFAIGPSALELALQLQSEHWRNAPIVFAAVDESSATRIIHSSGSTNITGRTLRLSLSKSVEVARILVPNLKHVALVGDALQKQPFRQHFRGELEAVAADLKLIDLTGMPLAAVKARVADLPSDAAIIYTAITDDGAGATLLPYESLAAIAEVAKRPIVVDVDNRIGRGGAGGFVVSASRLGEEGAQLVHRLFEGEAAAAIPIDTSNAMRLTFDWRQLKRWNVDETRLPASSEVRFREQSAWDQYGSYLSLMVVAI